MELNKNKKFTVNAPLEYIVGYIKNGHVEAILNENELHEFLELEGKAQIEFIKNHGHVIVDEFTIENYLPSSEISIHK